MFKITIEKRVFYREGDIYLVKATNTDAAIEKLISKLGGNIGVDDTRYNLVIFKSEIEEISEKDVMLIHHYEED